MKMKIVHICLASFFPDNYSYQENMLPKFHKEMGNDVEVIASTESFDKNGKPCHLDWTGHYVNEHGINVTRLPYKKNNALYYKFKKYVGTYEAIEKAHPDILFVHGCQFCDAVQIVRYMKKNPQVRLYVDNHADFSNSATNWLSKNVLHKIVWRHYANKLCPYVTKFYGVLPVRVDFLTDVYKLPKEKCELLVMGADDELVEQATNSISIQKIRHKYNIGKDDFLVMTGGKIDAFKTQTLLLMEAVHKIKDPKVRLIVFGSVTTDLMPKVQELIDGKKVQYVGWISSSESYQYFAAADLVVFPGRHSVFWEQVVGIGKPMLVKDWPGTHHVDLGGNVDFLAQDSAAEIEQKILDLYTNNDKYANMTKVAREKGMDVFSYKNISKRSVE